MPRRETERISTRPIRELAARRMRPGSVTRELLLRLPDTATPKDLVERMAAILDAAEVEAQTTDSGRESTEAKPPAGRFG